MDLHTEIQRGDSVPVRQVLGSSRQENLRRVSLSVTERKHKIDSSSTPLSSWTKSTDETEVSTGVTSPAGEVKGCGSGDVWSVDVSTAVQKTQHRLSKTTHIPIRDT